MAICRRIMCMRRKCDEKKRRPRAWRHGGRQWKKKRCRRRLAVLLGRNKIAQKTHLVARIKRSRRQRVQFGKLDAQQI